MGSAVLNWTQQVSIEAQLGTAVLNWAQLDSAGLNWTQLGPTGLNWAQLVSLLSNWAQLRLNCAQIWSKRTLREDEYEEDDEKSLFLKRIALRALKNFSKFVLKFFTKIYFILVD